MKIGLLISGAVFTVIAVIVGLIDFGAVDSVNQYITDDVFPLIWWLPTAVVILGFILGVIYESELIIIPLSFLGVMWIVVGIWGFNYFSADCTNVAVDITIDGVEAVGQVQKCLSRSYLFGDYGEYSYGNLITIYPKN